MAESTRYHDIVWNEIGCLGGSEHDEERVTVLTVLPGPNPFRCVAARDAFFPNSIDSNLQAAIGGDTFADALGSSCGYSWYF